MKVLNGRVAGLSAVITATLTLLVAPALAATTAVRPKLVSTQAQQDGKVMYVTVGFKVPKRDSTLPARATVCADGKCKTTKITNGLPVSEAQATAYAAGMHATVGAAGRRVSVTTSLTIGTRTFHYTSRATAEKISCGRAVRSHALPHC